MKIAYIANSRFPSEKAQSDHVMQMCASFAAQGHEVRLYVPDRRPVMHEDPFAYYRRERTFGFERVPCIDAIRWSWLGHLGLWIQTFTFVRNLQRAFRAWKPDVVYSRELYVFLLPMPGMRIWESHSLHHGWIAKRVLHSLDGVVTLTRSSCEGLEKLGIAAKDVFVEPDAVDPTLFEHQADRIAVRAKLGIQDGEILCLYTGKFLTMGMSKGLDEAIVAIRKLRSQGQHIRLLAVGGTKEELERYQKDAGDGIELMGHQPQRELGAFYAAADILLMPFPWTEHYAYYMSPLKLFEYLWSGIPMIVTDLPSVRDIVDERMTWFAKPGDVDSLIEMITAVIADPAEAHRRAEIAKIAAKKYTWFERAGRIAAWLKGRSSLA